MSSPTNMVSVKSMISIFENQSFNVDNNEPTRLIRRAKSIASINSTPIKKSTERFTPETNLELVQIEQQIQHLQKTLNNYKIYSRDNHIYYQNQIIFLLTDVSNIESKNNPRISNKKSELIEQAKKLNKILNGRLPSEIEKTKEAEVKKELPVLKINKRVEENREISKKRVESPKIEKHEEEDSPAPSVKTLKQLFEQNVTKNEDSKETTTKVTRKFLTFNGTSDTKYITYKERFTKDDVPQTPNNLYEQSVLTFDVNDEPEVEDEENEKAEDMSADSLSSEYSDGSSDTDSDAEDNGKEEENS